MSIVFPLRTNINSLQRWGKNDISKRIKQSIVLYNEIIIESGTYNFQSINELPIEDFCQWSETNTKEEILGTIERLENDQEQKYLTVLDRKTHAEKFKFKVDKKNLFIADFRTANIVSEIESGSYGNEVSFFKYLVVDRAPVHRNAVMQKSLKDLDDAPFAEEAERIQGKLPTIMFLNNLNDSLVISHRMNMPVAIDSIYVWMLKQRTKAQLTQRFSVLERLSRIGVPDFGDLSLEELLKLRKDKGLKAFRDFISTLSSGLKSDSDLNIEAAYTEEFMKLSREFAPNKKLALDLSSGVLSFIPCLLANVITSIADVGKKVKEYRDYSKTWVSFIQRANELDE